MSWRTGLERRRGVWLTLGLASVAIFALANARQPFVVILVSGALATLYMVAYELVRPHPRAGSLDVALAWTWRALSTGPLLFALGWVMMASSWGDRMPFQTSADGTGLAPLTGVMAAAAWVPMAAIIRAILRKRGLARDPWLIFHAFLVMVALSVPLVLIGLASGAGPETSWTMVLVTIAVTAAVAVIVSMFRLYRPVRSPRLMEAEGEADAWAQLRRA
jgi:hypothetical protein